jgi:pimeloyl-ACP methyl ester carboxylesterase
MALALGGRGSMSIAMAFAALVSAITAQGPSGPLAGTYVDAGKGSPIVLILPGSGPTDRDGNNPLGVKASSYRLLAEDLAARRISTVRVDKRGLFDSKAAVGDPNAVTLADYATDVRSWIEAIQYKSGANCVWLAGHSEGGLIALTAAQRPLGICGVITIAAPGRKMGDILREQLKSNPANAPILDQAIAAIVELEAGRRVDVSAMNPALLPLFAPQVQGYLMDLMAAEPARLAASLTVPLLVIQGGEDLQVTSADAEALHSAQPKSRLVSIAGMNHVLKSVAAGDRQANLAAYADPARPVVPAVGEAIAAFVLP